MIRTLSENVVVPIAGMIISFVLIYELITMVIDKNNMHDFDTSLFFRFLFKACIAVMLLSKTFDIVMAVFDVGSHVVTQAASSISGSTSLDVQATLTTMFNNQIDTMGMGYWTRSNVEICILATKGRPKRVHAGVHQVVVSHIEEHSRKPEEVHHRINQLMGSVPKIELFARRKAEGFDVWGKEVECDIELIGGKEKCS